MQIAPPPIAYELRVGVSGHRNLASGEQVARAVERLLDYLQRVFESATEFPHGPAGSPPGLWRRITTRLSRWGLWRSRPAATHVPAEQRTPLQWTVVSPLAAGADRIVARAVLNRPGGRLLAVSPFAVDDYRRDFRENGDRAEFDLLWNRDPHPVELGHDYALAAPDDTEEQLRAKKARRNEGYLQAGRWVVDHCEVLIAVWDGEEAAGRGGTGDVVRYAVEQGRTVLWINAEHPEQPAQWISGLETDRPLREAVNCRPLPARAKELSPNFHQLAAYNRDAAFDVRSYETSCHAARGQLQELSRIAGLREVVLAPALERLLPAYARADQLALRYQSRHVAATLWMHRLAAVAVTAAVVQVLLLFFPVAQWLVLTLIAVEVVPLVVAGLLFAVGRSEAWHEKWLRDRLLAEQMRMAIFTMAVRSGESQEQTQVQRFLPFYHAPNSWMVGALQTMLRDVGLVSLEPGDLGPLRQLLVEGWIADQARWHEANAARKERSAAWARWTGMVLFAVTFGLTLVAAAWHLLVSEPEQSLSFHTWLRAAPIVLAIVLPAWAAAVHTINSLLERERIAVRSHYMAQALREIANRASRAATFDELRAAAKQAAEVMAMENHEWWVLLSFCRPELSA